MYVWYIFYRQLSQQKYVNKWPDFLGKICISNFFRVHFYGTWPRKMHWLVQYLPTNCYAFLGNAMQNFSKQRIFLKNNDF